MIKKYMSLLLATLFFASTNLFCVAARSGSSAKNVTLVTSGDFHISGQTTLQQSFTISSAGSYILTKDINFDNGSDGQYAILVDTDNVELDLGGLGLYTNNTSMASTQQMGGIKVNNARKNVVVRNGHITSFSGVGVRVAPGCQNVHLECINVANTQDTGIYLGGTTDVARDCTISNCIISNCLGTHHVAVEDVTETLDAVGIMMQYANGIVINDCLVLSSSISGGGTDVYGVLLDTCTNVILNNCESSGHFGKSAVGYLLDACKGCRFVGCSSVGNHGIAAAASTISSNHAALAGAHGFVLDAASNDNVFENCVSKGHQGQYAGSGFYLKSSLFNRFTHCLAQHIHMYGPGIIPVASNSGFYGFRSVSGEGNIWEDCESNGHRGGSSTDTTSSNAPPAAYGWELDAEKFSTLYKCTARANGALTSHTGAAFGILLANSSTNCQIRECAAISNCSTWTTAALGGVGIKDSQASNSQSLILENFAFGNKADDNTNVRAQNYNVNLATGSFAEVSADLAGILDIANKPLYYNVGIDTL